MTSVSVDTADPTPPFEQIRRQLAGAIDSGSLAVGQRLPTVRQLAADLRVAPGTVSRAYKELEAAGYVETRRAAGTRVRARQNPAHLSASLQERACRFVDDAARMDATDVEIVEAVRTVLASRDKARSGVSW